MSTRTLNEIREVGVEALAASLGPVDAVRFLQQFDMGHGDYTAERKRLLGNPTVTQVLGRIHGEPARE